MSREEIPTEIRIPKGFEKAREKIVKNFVAKGNSWMNMTPTDLEFLLYDEIEEFNKESDPDELLDIGNIAFMLYDRMKAEDD